jgi:uncharacterized protein with FMN-binding domain
MIIGFVLALIFLVLVSKYITKRTNIQKLDSAMLKVHKVFGFLLLGVAIVHNLGVWALRKQRPKSMFIIGYIMIFLIVIGILSYLLRAKIGKKWITIHRLTAILIFTCLVTHVVIGFQSLASYKQAISETEIENVDFSNLADGTYIGSYDVGYVYAKMEVIIRDHKIDNIKILEHRTEQGEKAECIADSIVAQQSVKVDVISSATNSSKVIMKAVENALSGK